MGISIRFRKVSSGKFSAFLDIYHKGKRNLEHTEMLVTQDYSKPLLDKAGNPKLNEKGQPIYPKAKPEDREKLEMLERLKLEREVSVLQNTYAFIKKEKKASLIEFIRSIAATKKSAGCYTKLIPSLMEYVGPQFAIQDFDENKLRGYFLHLKRRGYNENTVQSMYFGINATLNQAVREKLIVTNPKTYLGRHEIPSGQESQRCFLSENELRILSETDFPHHNSQIRDAFLFSCFTGLRISDVTRITHSDVKEGVLQYRQKKSTKTFQYLPLNEQAMQLVRSQNRNSIDDRIFWDLPKYIQATSEYLQRWAKAASIDKHITWHVGRHTHATIMLNNGVDVFVLSKLLGHYSVETTTKYAKVVNKSKTDAVSKFPELGKCILPEDDVL
jgi:site-specific recombinase XerD